MVHFPGVTMENTNACKVDQASSLCVLAKVDHMKGRVLRPVIRTPSVPQVWICSPSNEKRYVN